MSAVASSETPHAVSAPAEHRLAAVAPVASHESEAAEQRRWMTWFGLPALLAAFFVGLVFGTGQEWYLGSPSALDRRRHRRPDLARDELGHELAERRHRHRPALISNERAGHIEPKGAGLPAFLTMAPVAAVDGFDLR